ncbi:MAG: hypothetical protein AABX54_00160 [Nanoarchaeota archaeon]
MTTIEEHKKILKEFIDDINEKIKSNLVSERQKIIGFAASEASTNLFAIFLHKNNLIEPSFNINHRHFSSIKRAEKVYKFEFQGKKEIINLLIMQENYRDKLCYGKAKDSKIVNSAIKNLFELKNLIEKEVEEK